MISHKLSCYNDRIKATRELVENGHLWLQITVKLGISLLEMSENTRRRRNYVQK